MAAPWGRMAGASLSIPSYLSTLEAVRSAAASGFADQGATRPHADSEEGYTDVLAGGDLLAGRAKKPEKRQTAGFVLRCCKRVHQNPAHAFFAQGSAALSSRPTRECAQVEASLRPKTLRQAYESSVDGGVRGVGVAHKATRLKAR